MLKVRQGCLTYEPFCNTSVEQVPAPFPLLKRLLRPYGLAMTWMFLIDSSVRSGMVTGQEGMPDLQFFL